MPGKVITIAQQKGGSGKTTIASNIAVGLMKTGASVAILDTDPQGSLGRWFMLRVERFGEDTEPYLGFRTASAWGARYEAMSLAKTYDYVIIDTPPKLGLDGKPAIEIADLVIVPVTPSPVDIWATSPTLDMAISEDKAVLTVLNRASERMKITGDTRAALAEVGGEQATTTLGNRVLYAQVMNTGHSVIEKQKTGPAAQEINQLVSEIEDKIKV